MNLLSKRGFLRKSFLFIVQKLLKVQEFLKVPMRELRSRQVKIHKGSLSNHIQNWDDVEKAVNGTQYESYLYGDYGK